MLKILWTNARKQQIENNSLGRLKYIILYIIAAGYSQGFTMTEYVTFDMAIVIIGNYV